MMLTAMVSAAPPRHTCFKGTATKIVHGKEIPAKATAPASAESEFAFRVEIEIFDDVSLPRPVRPLRGHRPLDVRQVQRGGLRGAHAPELREAIGGKRAAGRDDLLQRGSGPGAGGGPIRGRPAVPVQRQVVGA